MTLDEMFQLTEKRGYTLVAENGDKSWFLFASKQHAINLEVYPKTEEFKLGHIKGLYKISSGDCGSFKMDSHFERFEKQLIDIVTRLYN